jgi:hypothetical protein
MYSKMPAITPALSSPYGYPRFGATFNMMTERRLSRGGLQRIEARLKAMEPLVKSLSPAVDLGSGYVRAKQYIMLDTWDLSDDWLKNRQLGHTIRRRVSNWLSKEGFYDLDNTPQDAPFDEDYRAERSVFQTSNHRLWIRLLKWLENVDPERADYIKQTKDWRVVYPPAIWQMITQQRRESRLTP